MTLENRKRAPEIIREELGDLTTYLNGVPKELLQNGAFVAYEHRAAELTRELILSDLQSFATATPILGARLGIIDLAEYSAVNHALASVAEDYRKSSEHFRSATRTCHWLLLGASAGSIVSAISTATILVVPLCVVGFSVAAALSLLRLPDRSLEKQRLADSFAALRDEMAHNFGPEGQVLSPSEYYPASSRRVEQLLDELRTEVQRGAHP